ncbi:hypothetical protein B296_00006314 [Ensete ventricosum]|uniref:Uncharacterized protein n=1 Tax=Ensete ventricosum TaxID=4639 RepID=A0A426ZIJ3_ENSVE|nr:hypothetical protein B296_00006314 [Ensete ventricosum]
MGSRTSKVLEKNMMVINFGKSSSIDFSCIVSKIQNTGHSQRMPMGSRTSMILQKNAMIINFA